MSGIFRQRSVSYVPSPYIANATDPVTAYRVSLKSLARRYLELTDEIADQGELINRS
ncbi:hypothetical protein LQL77_31480 [Rhodococcus cerastii]|nr:hypothetical protein [Rhodococcus cerastii]